MIKYSPVRETLSASIKEEQVFDSIEDMKRYLFDHFSKIMSYIGSAVPFRPEEIIISDSQGYDFRIGYRNYRTISVRNTMIGFCGE